MLEHCRSKKAGVIGENRIFELILSGGFPRRVGKTPLFLGGVRTVILFEHAIMGVGIYFYKKYVSIRINLL